MHANITVTLRHRNGNEVTYKNVRSARERSESTINVTFVDLTTNRTHTDTFDALDWDITDVTHTEIPPQSR